ncbi:MAG: diguanylate cyclase [Candidatus Aegiribacteria sp.]|nr:diguanylate cyclase [Candidatus Aegiribacteria sp.]MBD3294446.1 diguanylate cyclase [Candidatus Fermentibacteria bacterium]
MIPIKKTAIRILDTIHSIEGIARDLYLIFSKKAEEEDLADFWRKFSAEEGEHLAFWENLKEIARSTPFDLVVSDPEDLLYFLEKTLYTSEHLVKDLRNDDPETVPTLTALLSAYRLELHMLDSRFQTLFQSLQFVQNDFDPSSEYDLHIGEFAQALKKFGSGYPATDLLALTLNRLWQENKRLAGLVLKDPLTGIYNRRGFMIMALQICALMRRKEAAVGLLMIDLDDFKKLNDTRGHAAGDKALVTAAETLTELLRASDVIGRYGGDEFIVLLPDTSDTETVFGKLISELNATLEESTGITATAGLAQGAIYCDDLKECLENLIKHADADLYRRKDNRSR